MLLKLIEEEKPTHFLVAFDAGKISFDIKNIQNTKGEERRRLQSFLNSSR